MSTLTVPAAAAATSSSSSSSLSPLSLLLPPRIISRRSSTTVDEEQEDATAATDVSQLDYEGRIDRKGDDHRCGFVCIVGAPNMGKSTLMNALLQEELCVATRRPQTTRHAILGILGGGADENCQVCLMDTPGVIDQPAYKLQEGMMEAVVGAFQSADAFLVVTDLFSTPIPDDDLFHRVQQSHKPVVVAVNKVDLVDAVNPDANQDNKDTEDGPERTVTIEQAVAQWRSLLPNAVAVLPIAAGAGGDDKGVTALRRLLVGGPDVPAAIRDLGRPVAGMFPAGVRTVTDDEAKQLLPISPPLYDDNVLTDKTERYVNSMSGLWPTPYTPISRSWLCRVVLTIHRSANPHSPLGAHSVVFRFVSSLCFVYSSLNRFFASEIIRASLFQALKKEVPYCCEVRITDFREPRPDDKKKLVRIEANILVERESQKPIVVGKGGETVKKVGIQAREQLEDFLQSKVHLDLRVRVEKDWRKDEKKLKEFGYLK